MRSLLLIIITLFFAGCINNNGVTVDLDENAHIAVCGEKDGQKQTYPTIKDLKEDGAKLIAYEPCYE